MFHTAYFCTERLRQKSSCTLLILPHWRGKLRHVVGKVEHGWKKRKKKRTSSFPGRGEEWALLFTPWQTYLWQSFFFPPSKSDCFKPSNSSSIFYHGRNHFILQIICKSLTTCVINKEKQFPTIFIQQKRAQLSLVFDSGDNNGLSGSSSPR